MLWVLGFLSGAALVGAAWAAWGWREKPDRHMLYIREWKRANSAGRKHRRARHRKTMPRLIRTKTIRRDAAPLPLEI